MEQILSALCAVSGPPGYEGDVAQKALEALRPLVDRCEIDALGNVLGYKSCGKKEAPVILLDAHLDEVGLMVTGEENGFLRFTLMGGVDSRTLLAREVMLLGEKPVYGVIASRPPHVQQASDMDKPLKVSDMLIDAGLSAEAAKRIPMGTPGVFFQPTQVRLGDTQLTGKAMDDRAGFVALLMTLTRLQGADLAADLVVCGSVQEEVGLRGARAASFSAAPSLCIAVDVTHGRTPDAPEEKTFALGGGPCVGVGPSMSRRVSGALLEVARSEKMAYQIEVMEGSTGTNAWAMQFAREGVPCAVVSIPLKYMHTTVEALSWDDMEATAQLLARFIEKRGGDALC